MARGHLLASSGPSALIFPPPKGCSVPHKTRLIPREGFNFFSQKTARHFAVSPQVAAVPLTPPPINCLHSRISGGRSRISFLQVRARAAEVEKQVLILCPFGLRHWAEERWLNMSKQSVTLPAWCISAPSCPFCAKCTFQYQEGEAQAVQHCTNPAVMTVQVQLSALLDSPRFTFSWFSSKAGVGAGTWGCTSLPCLC